MFRRGRSHYYLCAKFRIYWVIVIIAVSGLSPLTYGVNGQVADDAPAQVYITSRFILWDQYEKMIDNNFTVHILTLSNVTQNYTIMINNIIVFAGNVTYYAARQVNVTSEVISITVTVNGTEVFSGNNVIVMRDVTGGQIKRGRSPFTINLLPSEWARREWSIFIAFLTAMLVTLPMVYRGVKQGRKARGVKEIK